MWGDIAEGGAAEDCRFPYDLRIGGLCLCIYFSIIMLVLFLQVVVNV